MAGHYPRPGGAGQAPWEGWGRSGGRGPRADGAGQQQPGAPQLRPLVQPPGAVLPAGQALAFQPAGGERGVLARDRQRRPVLAGTAGAAEPQDPAGDAPDGHAVAAGLRLGLHQDRAVGEDAGVVALLDRANFRGEPVEPVVVYLAGIVVDVQAKLGGNFAHGPIVTHGHRFPQRTRSSAPMFEADGGAVAEPRGGKSRDGVAALAPPNTRASCGEPGGKSCGYDQRLRTLTGA